MIGFITVDQIFTVYYFYNKYSSYPLGAGGSTNTGERPGTTIPNNAVPSMQVTASLDSFISSSLEAPGENIKKSNVGAIIRIPINFDTVPNYAPGTILTV